MTTTKNSTISIMIQSSFLLLLFVNRVDSFAFTTTSATTTTREKGVVFGHNHHHPLTSSPCAFQAKKNRTPWRLSAKEETEEEDESVPDMSKLGFVLLAGGTGSRMKANMPKQFLTLRDIPVLHHSLDLFLNRIPAYLKEQNLGGPAMVVLVMDPKYQPEYQPIVDKYPDKLAFANPGEERQGSVENGLSKLVELAGDSCEYVAVHDSARPLVTIDEICSVVKDASEYGAAVLGVPCKATIKESEDGVLVKRTIPRSTLWEVHTPQVIRIETLLRGFKKVEEENLEVTDDVSIVEAMGEPVKMTRGEYTNLKITTPEDMDVAEAILEERKLESVDLLA